MVLYFKVSESDNKIYLTTVAAAFSNPPLHSIPSAVSIIENSYLFKTFWKLFRTFNPAKSPTFHSLCIVFTFCIKFELFVIFSRYVNWNLWNFHWQPFLIGSDFHIASNLYLTNTEIFVKLLLFCDAFKIPFVLDVW